MEAATYRALGADPIELPSGSALVSVDGAELSFELLKANPTVRDLRALATNVVLWPKPMTIVINAEKFASLTPRQRHALRDAGRDAFAAQMKLVSERDEEARRVLCKLGVPFVRAQSEELAALRAAVRPVYAEIERGAGNAAALREIETIKGGAAPDAPACEPTKTSAAGAAGRSTPIDGVYRTSFSKQELAHSPYLTDAGEINDGNWGVLTLRLTHGRMTFTFRNPRERGMSTGRYTVKGNTIHLSQRRHRRDLRLPLEPVPRHTEVPARPEARRRSDPLFGETLATDRAIDACWVGGPRQLTGSNRT